MKRNIILLLMSLLVIQGQLKSQNTLDKIPFTDIGTKSETFTYSHTQNTNNSQNYYVGQSTKDVMYKLTLTRDMEVVISHCGSAVSNTCLYLLNPIGNCIASNSSGPGTCSNSQNAYLKLTLQPGLYYIVSEGYSANGNITTNVSGSRTPQPQTTTSQNQNYIRKRTYTNEYTDRYLDVVQYYDGLGRPVQQIQVGVTPTFKDLVTHQEYDPFGREDKAWLPALADGNKGAFIPLETYKTKSTATYGNTTLGPSDTEPYAYPVYEASPLNRVEQQFGPGKNWHQNGKSVKTAYQTNDVSFLVPYFTTTDDKTVVSVTRSGNYPTNQLYVVKTTDEDSNISYQATDKLGRLVYTLQMDGNIKIETCYIYDIYDNLRCVLPPLAIFASGTWTESSGLFNDYAYAYKYDARNRCIAKKIPGAEWIYYIYDNADRLIFTQDGEDRLKSEWQFSIPDAFGRIVLTGICKNSYDFAANPLGTNTIKATYNTGRTNMANSYTLSIVSSQGITSTLTLSSMQILTANYYDSYAFMGIPEVLNNENTQYNPETGYDTHYSASSKGLLTGTVTAQLAANGTVVSPFLYSVMYYDKKGQLIQTKSNNHLAGGIEKEYFTYNFTGQPTKKQHVHSATGKATQTEVYSYLYDHAGRMTTMFHQYNGGATLYPIADNTYDELGRLKTNQKVVSNTKTTYSYNIRSWITSISSPLYVENLYYNNTTSTGLNPIACYNGNLSGISWEFKGSPDPFGCGQLGYNFYYDNLSRLKEAKFWRCGYYNQTDNRSMYLTYDKYGNILTLQRFGNLTPTTYGLIDNLSFAYYGIKFSRILDFGSSVSLGGSMDFKDYADKYDEYTYNANGAMTRDLNKGINVIQYNSLNLPRQMDIKSPVAEARNEYIYSATGNKLKVVQKYNPNFSTKPVIGSDVNTSLLTMSKTTDYVGNMIYENGALKRILFDGGYIENYQYYFYVTDHLGNNAVVVHISNAVKQKNQYYPFGMSFASDAEQGLQPYKYNGKELDQMHGLNLYDYSARLYDPAIGRFTTIDPLAEKYPHMSPYCAFANNPIRYTDPDGREIRIFFNPNNDKDKTLIQGAQKYKNDDAIHIFAHGTSKGIYPVVDGKSTSITSVQGFKNFLNEHSDTWKNRKEGENITIVLHSCRTGEGESSFAQEISSKLEGVTVIAPDQRDYIGTEGEVGTYKAKYVDKNNEYKRNSDGEIKSKERSNETGNWRVFKGGKETESYKGDWKPKENPSSWDKFWNKN